MSAADHFEYSAWRHGGWYVANVRYPSGACGCVSRNYVDRKWRIVCDARPNAHERWTYRTRDEAAHAELKLVSKAKAGLLAGFVARFGFDADPRYCADHRMFLTDSGRRLHLAPEFEWCGS